MPQMDVFTFFGQVTWFARAFVFYFSVVGGILLPSLNRSVKLREKKLAYQTSGSDVASHSASHGDEYSLALKSLHGSVSIPSYSVWSSSRLSKPVKVLAKSKGVKRLRTMLS